MKKFFLLLLCFLSFSAQALAMTYYNEPKGYDGVPWGSSATDFARYGKQIELLENSPKQNISLYKPNNQSLFIFNKKFDEITYHFYNDRFFMVTAIKRNDKEMSHSLYQTIKSQHGAHTQQNDNIAKKTTVYWWQGDNTFIRLTMDYGKNNSQLFFYNKDLYQQWSMNTNITAKPSGKIKERGK